MSKHTWSKRDKRPACSFKNKKIFYGKVLVILTTFLLIANMHLVYSTDTSGWAGSVIDPIIDGGSQYASNVASELADTFIQLLSMSFSPNFFTLMHVEHPSSSYVVATKQDVRNSYFFSSVFGLSQMLGVIIATILFFVNAFMILIGGRENKIRDNPVSMFIRYIVSMTAIFLSFEIVYSVIMSIDEIWGQYVFSGYTDIYAGQSFYQTESSRIFSQDPTTGNVIIWGAKLNVGLNGIWQAVFSCCGILIIWKLLKSLFRLYMEIAERYFVLMILCAFFPVAVSTYTCATTRSIFFSYLRMFFSQAFVMLANIAFMKFFLFVLFSGGWLASITNFICALAFVRVCQRLDSYMMMMGLNVAQTGTGLLAAIGGSGMGLMNMIRGTNNVRKNVGKTMLGMGISGNNAELFKAGAALGFSGDTLARGLYPADASFENSLARYSNSHALGFSEDVDGTESLQNTLKQNGVPTTDIDKLQNLGIDPNSITRVEKDQRTGAISYSDENGGVATSYKGEMFSNKMRDQEMAFNQKNAEISEKYDSTLGPDQSMSEADAARITLGMGDLNTAVSHVDLDTLNSLYAGDYESLEAIPVSKREQSESLASGDENVRAIPYGLDSVGHSQMQFRGRYMDKNTPKADDFFVDMYNIAQHPETLKNQGLPGWHFIKQGNEGFMVHDNRHTADDRPSYVGKTSPNYQKQKPNLNKPENHIESEKPSDNGNTNGTSGFNNGKGGSNRGGKNGTSSPTYDNDAPASFSDTATIQGFSGGKDKSSNGTPYPTYDSASPTTFSDTTTTTKTSTPFVYESKITESVNDAYERIYNDSDSSVRSPYEKDRSKGTERRENTKKDRDRHNRDSNGPKGGKGKGKGKSSRGPSHKNIPVDYED